MQKNIGAADRVIRIILGLVVIGAGFYFKSFLGLFGAVILGTGIVGWCGLYQIFGINTCQIKK